MKYEMKCKACNLDLGIYESAPEISEVIPLMVHAGGTHAGRHELSFIPKSEESFPQDRMVSVGITCLQNACASFQKEEVFIVPTWGVGATVLMYHSRMEGHPLQVSLNGIVISSTSVSK